MQSGTAVLVPSCIGPAQESPLADTAEGIFRRSARARL